NRPLWHRNLLSPRSVWPLHERRYHRRWTETAQQFARVVQELSTPAQVVFQDVVKLGFRGNLYDSFVEFVGRPKSFCIPGRNLAEHSAAMFLAENFYHQIQVPAHYAYALLEARLCRQFTCVQIMTRVEKNPRIVKRATADAYARAAGFIQHLLRRFGCGHI